MKSLPSLITPDLIISTAVVAAIVWPLVKYLLKKKDEELDSKVGSQEVEKEVSKSESGLRLWIQDKIIEIERHFNNKMEELKRELNERSEKSREKHSKEMFRLEEKFEGKFEKFTQQIEKTIRHGIANSVAGLDGTVSLLKDAIDSAVALNESTQQLTKALLSHPKTDK
jgi:membrane-associated HD superfamily phosphohydrolase